MPDQSNQLNPLQLIRDYVQELKSEFQKFSDDYHTEILKVWTEIVKIQEQIKTMKDDQKKQAKMWGLIGGAIPTSLAIVSALLIYWIKGPGAGP